MKKIFIIGLPRTGTTSLCAVLLELGFRVAHTALSKHTFTLAEVVADTPCYCDYRQLDTLFPQSKFIYSYRSLNEWLPSMRMLLQKIMPYIESGGAFHPVLKRCYQQTFALNQATDPTCDEHLRQVYLSHQQAVSNHFNDRPDLLTLDVTQADSAVLIQQFLGLRVNPDIHMPHLNQGRMVTHWKALKHPNKINSNAFGPERRKFFDYAQ